MIHLMKTTDNFPKYLLGVAIVTAAILMIPLIAMQFSTEVAWTGSDFIVAGVLLFGTGFMYGFVTRKKENQTYKFASGIAIFASLLLIWVNGAVGLIGSENEAFNLVYFGVLAIGLLGAAISRLKPLGMSNTLYAMASSFVVIIAIALISGLQNLPGSSVTEILGVNAFFMVLFALSAILYRHAASDEAEI